MYLTQTHLNAIHQDLNSSSSTDSSPSFFGQTSYSDLSHSITSHTTDFVGELAVRFGNHDTAGLTGASVVRITDSSAISDRRNNGWVEPTRTGPPLGSSDPVVDDHVANAVLQISGAGHWFLEGWICDNSVEFLVDSGSSVTAISDSLYQTLVCAGAPVGALGCTSRTLRGANGTGIGVSGCSHCVVSFMGLLTEFPILVCDLAAGTDAIIGTDVLGSVLPHTLARSK